MSADWNGLYRQRRLVRARWRQVFALPIAKRASDLVLAALPVSPARAPHVLDVGANDRRLRERVVALRADAVYHSADPDPAFVHDYRWASDAPVGTYDVVACFEVIEHLTLAEALALLGDLRERLRPGGKLVLTTPNVFMPGQFHRDATHVTAYAYDELGGALLETGFDLAGLHLYRVYNDGLLGKLLHRVVVYPLHRALGVDFAGSIAAVATRPANPS